MNVKNVTKIKKTFLHLCLVQLTHAGLQHSSVSRLIADGVGDEGSKIGRVRPSVCFRYIFGTN